jgi:glycosyltransferase involved in cell wall biosynthesis
MEIEKLKILFWRTEFYGAVTTGGVAGMHRGMINALNELGHESVFATSGRLQLPEYVNQYYIPYNKLFRNLPEVLTLPYINKSVSSVKSIINKENPDFLFMHHHDFTIGGAKIKRDTGIPFLLHCDFIQQWVKKYWGKLYFPHLLKWAEEIQWENADAIFVISEVAKKIMSSEYGVNPDKIVVNPNGVNTDFFKFSPESRDIIRKKLGIESKFVNGFAGSFGVYHGIEYLAQAVKSTVRQLPEAIFLFIGDGELRGKVEQIIKDDNVQNHVIFTGMVPYEEVPKYLSACDVLHSPCINNEDSSEYFGSPTKLFEYMGMGLPIVATSVGQQTDVIQDNYNGVLINEKNPEEISNAIVNLHNNKDNAENLGKNSRRDAVQKWDWKNNVNRIIETYKKIKINQGVL